MLQWANANAGELSGKYGNVSKASVGAIQRQLLSFEAQGADHFFGEPALEIDDFLQLDEQGRGYVNVLAADKLMRSPKLYATFLLWLLAELFESLPEVGDPEKPKLVFFFDEAHLLFDDAPKALQDTIEQVVRLIRSKGVGVFFVTQNPIDIPEEVAGQLGNRVQHALRAFYPARPTGDPGGGGDVPDQSRARCRGRDHRTEGRRGAGLDPRRGRRAHHRRAHADQAAAFAARAGEPQGAARSFPVDQPARRQNMIPRVNRESAEEVLAAKAAMPPPPPRRSRNWARRRSASGPASTPACGARRSSRGAQGRGRRCGRDGGRRKSSARKAAPIRWPRAITSAAGIDRDRSGRADCRTVRAQT